MDQQLLNQEMMLLASRNDLQVAGMEWRGVAMWWCRNGARGLRVLRVEVERERERERDNARASIPIL